MHGRSADKSMAEIRQEMIDKQMTVQKEKNFRGPCKPTKKCASRKTTRVYNVIDGRKHFIRCIRKIGENNSHKLRVNNSEHIEGTICFVNELMSGCQGGF